MEQKRCPRCNNVVAMEAKYCENCGYSFTESTPYQPSPLVVGRSGILTAGGVLLIVSSAVALVGGLVGFSAAFSSSYYYSHYPQFFAFLIILGVFGVIGFAFGLASGIQSLRRRQFGICVAGAVLLLLAGVLHFASMALPTTAWLVLVVFFGLPITVLTVLGLIFLAIRRREFR